LRCEFGAADPAKNPDSWHPGHVGIPVIFDFTFHFNKLIDKMRKAPSTLIALSVLFALSTAFSFSQNKKPHVCKAKVFAALVPIPKLEYECQPEAEDDYGEAVLKRPERREAIRKYIKSLASLNSAQWWAASTEDLTACYLRKDPGVLTEDQERDLRNGEFEFHLQGDASIRFILAPDPCFRRGFNGSNAFILYRDAKGVHVTEVIDGFSSRADNPIFLSTAILNSERIIELATGTGGLNPYVTNYYFVIDKRTGKAVPKKLFKYSGKLTNEMTSVLTLSDLTGPGYTQEMQVIKHGRLAPKFIVYDDDSESKYGEDGRPLRKTVYRWIGHYYVPGR